MLYIINARYDARYDARGPRMIMERMRPFLSRGHAPFQGMVFSLNPPPRLSLHYSCSPPSFFFQTKPWTSRRINQRACPEFRRTLWGAARAVCRTTTLLPRRCRPWGKDPDFPHYSLRPPHRPPSASTPSRRRQALKKKTCKGAFIDEPRDLRIPLLVPRPTFEVGTRARPRYQVTQV